LQKSNTPITNNSKSLENTRFSYSERRWYDKRFKRFASRP